jgi:hypothetical protein
MVKWWTWLLITSRYIIYITLQDIYNKLAHIIWNKVKIIQLVIN